MLIRLKYLVIKKKTSTFRIKIIFFLGFSESGGHETWRNAKKIFSIFGPITILSVL